jgi:hypothetical protein
MAASHPAWPAPTTMTSYFGNILFKEKGKSRKAKVGAVVLFTLTFLLFP